MCFISDDTKWAVQTVKMHGKDQFGQRGETSSMKGGGGPWLREEVGRTETSKGWLSFGGNECLLMMVGDAENPWHCPYDL